MDPGIEMLEEKGNVPVVGVTPYLQVEIEDEDSLTRTFHFKGKWRACWISQSSVRQEFLILRILMCIGKYSGSIPSLCETCVHEIRITRI